MAYDFNPTPSFAGFPDFRANVTFVPIQFFTLVVPSCSRGTVRIVGYALRKVLGWVDESGNPTREQLRFTYRELIEKAAVSRGSIPEALREAVERRFLRCVQPPEPDRNGQPAASGIYELRWDEEGRYTDRLADFQGFYYPEAVLMETQDGSQAEKRPKAARKNIPNAFFDHLLPRERLSVIRVVAALLFYSIKWGPGGERKVPVSRSITELSRLTRLSRHHVHEAVMEARQRGYIEQVDAGLFDPAAGNESRAATYGIRWTSSIQTGRVLSAGTGVAAGLPVQKGERGIVGRSEKVNGALVQKGERNQSEKVNEERSKMVNGISIKTELKKEQTTTTAVGSSSSSESVAVAVSSFDLLREVGFDEATARRLGRKRSKEVIQNQIGWLPGRTATRNRLGFLRRAIEQNWPKPEGVEAPEGSLLQQAKLFASHYYAAYHDFPGEAATEPLPKDLEMAAKFIPRLPTTEQAQMPEWGRRFGRLMRDKHRNDTRAKPNLSFALVLFGDRFLRTLQSEQAARQRQALGEAREAHQAAFQAEYISYLRFAESKLQQAHPSVYAAFDQHRQQLRRFMTNGPFLASAERLARLDSEENRLLDFAEFFHRHPQQPVPSFWEWDARLNPRRFGASPIDNALQEANA